MNSLLQSLKQDTELEEPDPSPLNSSDANQTF